MKQFHRISFLGWISRVKKVDDISEETGAQGKFNLWGSNCSRELLSKVQLCWYCKFGFNESFCVVLFYLYQSGMVWTWILLWSPERREVEWVFNKSWNTSLILIIMSISSFDVCLGGKLYQHEVKLKLQCEIKIRGSCLEKNMTTSEIYTPAAAVWGLTPALPSHLLHQGCTREFLNVRY